MAKPLDEQTWQRCRDPELMLIQLRDSSLASERKLRLWACACLRRLWKLIPEEESRRAVEVAECYADGLVRERALGRARRAAPEVDGQGRISFVHWAAIQLTHYEGPSLKTVGRHEEAYRVGGAYAAAVVASVYAARGVSTPRDALLDGNAARELERTHQAELIRHHFGDPFRPLVCPAYLPHTVLSLANALYNGDNVAFALHDALLEEGLSDFAAHFGEAFHPKGCAWLDAILGKS